MNTWEIFTLVYAAIGLLVWIAIYARAKRHNPLLPMLQGIMLLLVTVAFWPLAITDMLRGEL